MEYRVYVEQTQRAATLTQAAQYDEALTVLTELVDSDISDIDKSMMCLNLAVVCDKRGRVDEALAWHDRGAAIERPYARAFVALHKAGYLATQGRVAESVEAYRALAGQPFLTEADRETIRRNITMLLGE